MHRVIVQTNEGPQLRTLLEYLRALGVSLRVIFPPHEYGKPASARNQRKAEYETARLYPRGDDGGFAEEFLNNS